MKKVIKMLAFFMLILFIYMMIFVLFIMRLRDHQMKKERADKKRNYMGPEDEPEWTEYTRKFIS
jgi:preprotein translocase subunit YajC